MPNKFGWPLPLTDQMMEEESPYAPPGDPAENVARRLVMLTHLSFNSTVWGGHTGRLERYWPALAERVEGAAYSPDVASWWVGLIRDISGVPLRHTMLLHEKNLLTIPTKLSGTPVPDDDVLAILREYAPHLIDLTRVWAKARREAKVVQEHKEDEN